MKPMMELEPKRKEMVAMSSPCASANDSGEDNWVIVKKQKVYIHIPPLHFAEQMQSTINNNPEPDQAQEEFPIGDLAIANGSRYVVPKNGKFLPSFPTKDKDARRFAREVDSLDSVSISTLVVKPVKLEACKSNTTFTARRPGPGTSVVFCVPPKASPRNLHWMLRASNLERKLTRVGGLNRWLASLGLEQFIRVFQGKNVSKFQLVNMSMKKLKDMGAHAVGPRRKLIHAIDCLCQPYCFIQSSAC
ncbi:hypothetical protein Dimus_029926 [Dionaea muscipula]